METARRINGATVVVRVVYFHKITNGVLDAGGFLKGDTIRENIGLFRPIIDPFPERYKLAGGMRLCAVYEKPIGDELLLAIACPECREWKDIFKCVRKAYPTECWDEAAHGFLELNASCYNAAPGYNDGQTHWEACFIGFYKAEIFFLLFGQCNYRFCHAVAKAIDARFITWRDVDEKGRDQKGIYPDPIHYPNGLVFRDAKKEK
jgi:hypothetical protein